MSGRRARAKGMALIAVLWVVAALSLMLAALMHTVRSEIRHVSQTQSRLRASAMGDAAIYLVLQRVALAPQDHPKQSTAVEVFFDSVPIRVQVTPANGFIDINNAPAGLLRLMLGASGMVDAQAQELAAEIVAYRTSKDIAGKALGFNAPEDLLRVPGVDFDLYAKVAPLVTADIPLGGSGKVNPLAAPLPVLNVLAGGNMAAASAIANARDAGTPGVDVSSLDSQYVADTMPTAVYSLQAEVPTGANTVMQAVRTVILGSPGQRGIPWQTIRTEQRLRPTPELGQSQSKQINR